MPVRMREAEHRLRFSQTVQVARFMESSKENLFNQLYRIILKIKGMSNVNEQRATIETPIFGSEKMRNSAPTETIPMHPTSPEIAYQMVKDETFPQTQPRLNLATFVTTYMDDYATKLMNEAIDINYIDETEYPRVAVMAARCINIMANLWHSPEQAKWKAGALAIGSSEACMLGGVAAWLRWRAKRKAQGKPYDKPNFVISTGFQVVWEKFAQLWQIEMRTGSPDAREDDARSAAGSLDVRRKYDLRRADRRRDVDGSERRRRGARPGAGGLQCPDRLRYSDSCGCRLGRLYPAVSGPGQEMGFPAEVGALHQHFGA